MSDPRGLEIARQLIAEEAEKKTGSLDLGNLGLTDFPPEMVSVSHLQRLYLGECYYSEDGNYQRTKNDIGTNRGIEKWRLPARFDDLSALTLSDSDVSVVPEFSVLLNLKLLDCWSTHINDLTPLANLQNLSSISCYDTQVSDLTPLANLQNLSSLNCSSTRVSDLTPLANLQNLSSIDCRYTQVSDLTPLANLQNLSRISCGSTQVSDLTPLAKIQNLSSIYCSSTQVIDLAPLANLQNLSIISCWSTQVCDLAALANLQNLSSIDCDFTRVSDLTPLANLQNLSTISCNSTQVSDLTPLANLQNLSSINCRSTPVNDVTPLANLPNLSNIDCSSTPVSDLTPLANLPNLNSISCSSTPVSDLTPLANLPNLNSISCSSTPVSDLTPLAKLQNLSSINCRSTPVNDVTPLANLPNLSNIDCSSTPVSDLTPLAKLPKLSSIDCSSTPVSDLTPLAKLQNLSSISCSSTPVSDLTPLAKIQNLSSISCSSTPVSDLTPLANLQNLNNISCNYSQVTELAPLLTCGNIRTISSNGCSFRDIPRYLMELPNLESLYLHEASVPGIPAEVLSVNDYSDCLNQLRSHFADLSNGVEPVLDVKVIVIGNGRTGKTQICRRLMGLDYDSSALSTHGITVTNAPLEMPKNGDEASLNLWDFGGQDLYHGTHSLFMKTRAVFVVVWADSAESSEEYTHGGMRFRNQRLPYWLQYVRNLAGKNSPVVIVQNQCDTATDESELPVNIEDFKFPYHQTVHYSAKDDRKRATLDDALREAIQFLRNRDGIASIGKGRMKVRKQLLKWRHEDAQRLEAGRRHRTLTQDEFGKLCEKAGGVSSPGSLLEYLHNCGIVFYQQGAFDDQIVLDQSWALDAVYAVFQRDKCYRQLRSLGGRFTRSLLEMLVWQKYSQKDQELFLSLMRSCGICFVHRKRPGDQESEYVAPDLLPDREAVDGQLAGRWNPILPIAIRTWSYEFLHPGFVRTVMSKLGSIAQDSAVYWKYGLWAYDASTRASFRLDQQMIDESAGQLVLQSQGDGPDELVKRIAEIIEQCHTSSGCSKFQVSGTDLKPDQCARERKEIEEKDGDSVPQPKLQLVDPPRPKGERRACVSYAWKDERTKEPDRAGRVETFCGDLAKSEIKVIRDTTDLNRQDRLSQFMRTIASGDVVFVFLSDAYLRSSNCMYELLLIWQGAKDEADNFLKQIRVFPMPGTSIHKIADRLEYAAYWLNERDQIRKTIDQHGIDVLGPTDLSNWKRIQDFAHNVNEMLAQISDILLEGEFDKFIANAIDELRAP